MGWRRPRRWRLARLRDVATPQVFVDKVIETLVGGGKRRLQRRRAVELTSLDASNDPLMLLIHQSFDLDLRRRIALDLFVINLFPGNDGPSPKD